MFTIWLVSFPIAVIPLLFHTSSSRRKEQIKHLLHCTLYTSISNLLLLLGLYLRHVRNRHELNIRKQNAYFGIVAETLYILQKLSTSIVDILKLNVATAILFIVKELLKLLQRYVFLRSPVLFGLIGTVRILYVLANPFVYALSMSELKKEYRGVFRRFRARIGVFSTNTQETTV